MLAVDRRCRMLGTAVPHDESKDWIFTRRGLLSAHHDVVDAPKE